MRRFYKPSLWIPQLFLFTNPNLHHGLLGAVRTFSTARIVAGIAGVQLAAFVAETRKVEQAHPLEGELKRGSEHAEAILHATPEVNGRSLLEVLCWTRDFSDAKAEVYALGEHLIVKDKVVGVFEQG